MRSRSGAGAEGWAPAPLEADPLKFDRAEPPAFAHAWRSSGMPGEVRRPFSHRGALGEWRLAGLEAHAKQLQRGGYTYLGATSYADELRHWTLDPSQGLPIPGYLASLPALAGAGASSIFDRLIEHPPRARRTDLAWRRFIDGTIEVEAPTFYFVKSIEAAD